MARYVPGSWFAVVGAHAAVLLPPEESGRVAATWDLVQRDPSLAELLDAFLRDGLGKLPSFALASWDDTGLGIVLRGPVSASAGGAGFDGSGISTWVERRIEGAATLTLAPGTIGASADEYAVLAGVVLVDALVVDTTETGVPTAGPTAGVADAPAPIAATPAAATPAAAAPAAVVEPPPTEPELSAPILPPDPQLESTPEPEAEPAAEPEPAVDPHATWAPSMADEDVADREDDEPPAAAKDAAAAAPGLSDPYDGGYEELFGATIARRPEDAAIRALDEDGDAIVEPDPVEEPAPVPPVSGEAEAPAPPARILPPPPPDLEHDGRTVFGGVRKAPAPPPAPAAPPQVPLLHLSTGEVIELDRVVIVGRAPEARRFQQGQQPRLVPVTSPQLEVSGTHLEVRAEQGGVVATDLGSTNGTTLTRPGQYATRLAPGEATPVPVGGELDLGDGVRITVVESR